MKQRVDEDNLERLRSAIMAIRGDRDRKFFEKYGIMPRDVVLSAAIDHHYNQTQLLIKQQKKDRSDGRSPV